MSRYTAINNATGRPIAWGYDRPNSEYFLTEFWNKEESKELDRRLDDEEDIGVDPEVVFSVASYFTTAPHPEFPKRMQYSNSEILELMNRYPEIPKGHKDAVALDIPF